VRQRLLVRPLSALLRCTRRVQCARTIWAVRVACATISVRVSLSYCTISASLLCCTIRVRDDFGVGGDSSCMIAPCHFTLRNLSLHRAIRRATISSSSCTDTVSAPAIKHNDVVYESYNRTLFKLRVRCTTTSSCTDPLFAPAKNSIFINHTIALFISHIKSVRCTTIFCVQIRSLQPL
jgi:hypothetical protein